MVNLKRNFVKTKNVQRLKIQHLKNLKKIKVVKKNKLQKKYKKQNVRFI